MAITYSITKAGAVNHEDMKGLLQTHVLLAHEIMRKTEQYEIVRLEQNELFIDIIGSDLMRLSSDLVRIAELVRDKVDSTIAA